MQMLPTTILAFVYVQITVPTEAPVVICFVTQAAACRQLVGNQQITHFQTARKRNQRLTTPSHVDYR